MGDSGGERCGLLVTHSDGWVEEAAGRVSRPTSHPLPDYWDRLEIETLPSSPEPSPSPQPPQASPKQMRLLISPPETAMSSPPPQPDTTSQSLFSRSSRNTLPPDSHTQKVWCIHTIKKAFFIESFLVQRDPGGGGERRAGSDQAVFGCEKSPHHAGCHLRFRTV